MKATKIIAFILKITIICYMIFLGMSNFSNDYYKLLKFTVLVFIPAFMGYETIIKTVVDTLTKNKK